MTKVDQSWYIFHTNFTWEDAVPSNLVVCGYNYTLYIFQYLYSRPLAGITNDDISERLRGRLSPPFPIIFYRDCVAAFYDEVYRVSPHKDAWIHYRLTANWFVHPVITLDCLTNLFNQISDRYKAYIVGYLRELIPDKNNFTAICLIVTQNLDLYTEGHVLYPLNYANSTVLVRDANYPVPTVTKELDGAIWVIRSNEGCSYVRKKK